MELYRELYKTNPEFILAEKICGVLHSQGFRAYLAGGCVRDFLLQRQPHDFDVTTNALPDQVEKLFKKTIAVGKDFGVIVVVDDLKEDAPGVMVEVATFRKDGKYEDGRHPTSVEFSDEKEDALRRDLTVNALFFDLPKNKVIDYVQGLLDLQGKSLRAVGDPEKRFQEDHLRILRTIRFSCQLGFEIELETASACRRLAPLIQKVSGERIQEELSKLILGDYLEKGLRHLFDLQVLSELTQLGNLQWKSPTPYFSSRSVSSDSEFLGQAWFEFFLWISQLSPLVTVKFFEERMQRWKFSKDLKTKTVKSLQWIRGEKSLAGQSLGELLALSFESEHLRGMICYGKFFLQENEKPLWDAFVQRKKSLGPNLPRAWVTAVDLMGEVRGPALGQALRYCYHRQLEGALGSQTELIMAWRKQHGNG